MVAEHHQQNTSSLPHSKVERLRTGFALLGAPLAWAAHLCVMYFLVQPVCQLGGDIWFHITTVAMLIVCIAAGVVAWRHRTGEGGFRDFVDGTGSWRSFVAIFGITVSVLFAYAIIYQWAPVLTYGACEGMRPLP